MSRTPHCLIRGSINIDEFFHVKDIVRPGETISSTSHSRRAGGKGANQAVAVAKAGGRVTLVGAVGEDGAWIKDQLNGFGVNVEGIKIVEESTGRAIIQLTELGENSIILYKGANYTPLSQPSPSLAPYTHILFQNEIPFHITHLYLRLAKSPALQRRIITIYNPSPMPTPDQISHDIEWEHIDWLVVNEGEAQQLLDACPAASHVILPEAQIPEGAPASVLRSSELLSRLTSRPSFKKVNIMCTLGPLGVLARLPSATMGDDTQVIYEPGAPTKEVRDTTGAGDCWTGYLVAGLMELEEKSTSESILLDREYVHRLLKKCNQAAGMCVEKDGAMESIPYSEQVEARLQASS